MFSSCNIPFSNIFINYQVKQDEMNVVFVDDIMDMTLQTLLEGEVVTPLHYELAFEIK